MPPVVLHCLVHLTDTDVQWTRFPAVYTIKNSLPDDKAHYNLGEMMLWATLPYAVWQLSYHILITVRRREKIAAGRPTSFTWLRKSYAKTWIGKAVLSLPESLQESAFMLIQYCYAVITMIPCPIWFWHRWLSATFLFVVFSWSIYNGATFYIDVFGRRFQNELEQLKRDVVRWQNSPEVSTSPGLADKDKAGITSRSTPHLPGLNDSGHDGSNCADSPKRASSIDQIPWLDGKDATASGSDVGTMDVVRGQS